MFPQLPWPASQTGTQALTISRQSTQSAACYQLSKWISGTNVITAGVFIYIIIITALPRGARGEHQGLGRDEGWDRGEGGRRWTVKTAGRVKSLPVEKDRWARKQTVEELKWEAESQQTKKKYATKNTWTKKMCCKHEMWFLASK